MLTNTNIFTADRSWFYSRGLENVSEQIEPLELTVQGIIPDYVQGVLYRAGPGTYEIKTKTSTYKFHHWFDGLSMIHRFEIHSDGRVTYRNRKTAKGIENAIAKGKYRQQGSFGQDPCNTIFQKFFTIFFQGTSLKPSKKPDESNVGVTLNSNSIIAKTPHSKNDDTLVVKTDANILQELDPVTLKPLRSFNFATLDPSLKGPLAPAHDCTDPDTGEFFSFVIALGLKTTYKVFSIKPTMDSDDPFCHPTTTRILATITDAPAAYVHSFGLTKKYVILAIWQCDIDPLKLLWNRNYYHSFKEWDPSRDTIFYVIDRIGDRGVIAKYTAPTFFCFHVVNAYDRDDHDNDDVVIDLAGFDDNSLISTLFLDNLLDRDNLKKNGYPHLGEFRRYVLADISKHPLSSTTPLPSATLTKHITDPTRSFDLPTIHPNLYGRPYNYLYGVSTSHQYDTPFWDQLIKIPANSSDPACDSLVWTQKHCTPSEPIFVPRPGATREDEGVCLSVVLDGDRGESFLLVLDAENMTEIGRATLQKGKIVGYGFHGTFVAADV